METSTSNAANGIANGIVALSSQEIEMVSGGKSAVATKPFFERVMDWISSWGSGAGSSTPSQAASAPPMSPSDYIPMLEACVAAGGSFTFDYSVGGGAANLSIVSAEGSGTTVRVTCN